MYVVQFACFAKCLSLGKGAQFWLPEIEFCLPTATIKAKSRVTLGASAGHAHFRSNADNLQGKSSYMLNIKAYAFSPLIDDFSR